MPSEPETFPATVPVTRPVSAWRRFTQTVGWPALVAVAAWVGFSRHLVGTDGSHVLIYLLTLVPVLLIAGIMALAVPLRRKQVISARASAWFFFALGWGLVLGLFLPDEAAGPTAVVSVLFGEGWQGAESAVSNPAAVIMVFSMSMAAVFAWLDSRPGGPVRTHDEDHAQGTGYYPVLGE